MCFEGDLSEMSKTIEDTGSSKEGSPGDKHRKRMWKERAGSASRNRRWVRRRLADQQPHREPRESKVTDGETSSAHCHAKGKGQKGEDLKRSSTRLTTPRKKKRDQFRKVQVFLDATSPELPDTYCLDVLTGRMRTKRVNTVAWDPLTREFDLIGRSMNSEERKKVRAGYFLWKEHCYRNAGAIGDRSLLSEIREWFSGLDHLAAQERAKVEREAAEAKAKAAERELLSKRSVPSRGTAVTGGVTTTGGFVGYEPPARQEASSKAAKKKKKKAKPEAQAGRPAQGASREPPRAKPVDHTSQHCPHRTNHDHAGDRYFNASRAPLMCRYRGCDATGDEELRTMACVGRWECTVCGGTR
jgi:hypothetical protein